MKNAIFFKSIQLFVLVLLLSSEISGQINYANLSLQGPEYKLVPVQEALNFSLQIESGIFLPSEKGIENYDGGGMDSLIQKVYADYQFMENLYEELGGEFFFGSFSEAPKLENFKVENAMVVGFSGAYRVHSNFDVKLQFSAYKSRVTAEFPIVVFDDISFETTSSNGRIVTELKSRMISISGNYYPFVWAVQPFVGVGMVFNNTLPSVTNAEIGSAVFELSENPASKSIGLILKAGAQASVSKHVFLQLSVQTFSDSTASGVAWNKMIYGGVGVRF